MKRITAIMVLAVLLLAGCAGQAMTWQEQYDLGMRYLNESNYEEAILAFTQAIEIDPKNVDGYLGRAEAYLGAGGEENRALAVADYLTAADICVEQGGSERAEEILNDAQETMGEEQEISDKLYEITGKRPNAKLENEYYANGNLKVEYQYDENDLLVKEIYYIQDGSEVYYYTYEGHNENGMPTKCNHYYDDSGKPTGYDIREYDENGLLVKKNNYSTDGSTGYCFIYEYDENGNLRVENTYDTKNVLSSRDKYDENGNHIEEEMFGYATYPDGTKKNTVTRYTWEYNEAGQMLKENFYGVDGNLWHYFVYEYDERDNLIKSTYYEGNGTMTYYSIYEYDEQGNIIKASTYEQNGNLQIATEYDIYGNIINTIK